MEDDEEPAKAWSTIGCDPIEGARLCRQQIKHDQLSQQARLRRRIAEGYYIGLRLMEDYTEWQRFLSDPFFDKDPRIRNKKEDRYKFIVMRTVMIYLFMADKTNDSLRNRTWRYARAMDGYAEDGVLPEKAAAQIKLDGGIEKLCRDRSKQRNLENEDRDWRLEMAHREPSLDLERAQPREAKHFDHIASQESSSETDEYQSNTDNNEDQVPLVDNNDDDDDEAEEPYVDPDPMEGMVVWPVMVEPDELKSLDRASIGENIRATIRVRRGEDGGFWYEATMIDYLG